jgi:hypothetical protein
VGDRLPAIRLISDTWDQFFRTNFPDLVRNSSQYKPNPDTLDPCSG